MLWDERCDHAYRFAEAYPRTDCDGHLVSRLIAGMVPLDTARVLFKGQVMREASGFSLKHHWHFLDAAFLERQGLSGDFPLEAP
jgi:hypothetical protein